MYVCLSAPFCPFCVHVYHCARVPQYVCTYAAREMYEFNLCLPHRSGRRDYIDALPTRKTAERAALGGISCQPSDQQRPKNPTQNCPGGPVRPPPRRPRTGPHPAAQPPKPTCPAPVVGRAAPGRPPPSRDPTPWIRPPPAARGSGIFKSAQTPGPPSRRPGRASPGGPREYN